MKRRLQAAWIATIRISVPIDASDPLTLTAAQTGIGELADHLPGAAIEVIGQRFGRMAVMKPDATPAGAVVADGVVRQAGENGQLFESSSGSGPPLHETAAPQGRGETAVTERPRADDSPCSIKSADAQGSLAHLTNGPLVERDIPPELDRRVPRL